MTEFRQLDNLKKRMRQVSIPDLFKKRMKTMDSELLESEQSEKKTEAVDFEKSVCLGSSRGDSALGTPISELNTMQAGVNISPLNASDCNHKVLVDFKQLLNLQGTAAVYPYPRTYKDKWDNKHVRMPCSPENLYPVDDAVGGKKIKNRWALIRSTLSKPILSSQDIEAAITSYNSRYAEKWNFVGLHYFFKDILNSQERKLIFEDILPYMIQLTLDLPNICTQPPPLLARGQSYSVTLSQKQISSLLANAFFCTFPRRNTQRKQSEYCNYPEINFIQLFNSSKRKITKRQAEKLKCIFHYFLRVSKKEPIGCVTFYRRSLNDFPNWSTSSKKLTKLSINSRGTIEDDGTGMLQVDFANEFIGGGVLGQGCVQEEIRFVICPELIISRLLTEALGDNECLIITGCERFSRYKGYSDDFIWDGDFLDTTPKDCYYRRLNQIVAIDATYFKQSKDQFQEKWLTREINKAYCGFYDENSFQSTLPAVATGNWGCGVYRGDPHLKLLLQLIAAAECNRDVAYFTFSNSNSCREMYQMHKFLVSKNVTVACLWNLLLLYQQLAKCNSTDKQLYQFIYDQIQINIGDKDNPKLLTSV